MDRRLILCIAGSSLLLLALGNYFFDSKLCFIGQHFFLLKKSVSVPMKSKLYIELQGLWKFLIMFLKFKSLIVFLNGGHPQEKLSFMDHCIPSYLQWSQVLSRKTKWVAKGGLGEKVTKSAIQLVYEIHQLERGLRAVYHPPKIYRPWLISNWKALLRSWHKT